MSDMKEWSREDLIAEIARIDTQLSNEVIQWNIENELINKIYRVYSEGLYNLIIEVEALKNKIKHVETF